MGQVGIQAQLVYVVEFDPFTNLYKPSWWFDVCGDGQVDDYRRFEESLDDDKGNDQVNENKSQQDLDDKEVRVGIKDW